MADTFSDNTNSFDILVIGGGISGINTSYRLQERLPNATFAVLESRHEIGGTWSQFQYPGVRSDSDLHTFGFPFNPWKSSNSIASGESIMSYMHETVDKFGLARYFRFGHKVKGADWRPEEQRWRVEVDVKDEQAEKTRRVVYWTKWLIMGTGYYSYDKPADAIIPGLEDFKGKRVHPQFWPKDLQLENKRVVVIGSGATAITLMPALVDCGVKQVTQLQRSPSYVMNVPQAKPEDKTWIQRWAPEWLAEKWTRFVHVLVPILLYQFCMYFPGRIQRLVHSEAKKQLPEGFEIDPHLKPSYNPWQQRMCYSPDGDYFQCFKSGRADIVTDTIKTVTANGILLDSGKKLDADIIVTATGLRVQLFGGMSLSVNGRAVDVPNEYLWRNAMLTSVPNFGNIIGYWNHSWTLGSDCSARLFIRIMKHMAENGYTSVTPTISQDDKDRGELGASPLTSTYIKSAARALPKCAPREPWRPRSNYLLDRWRVARCDLNDGLKYDAVST